MKKSNSTQLPGGTVCHQRGVIAEVMTPKEFKGEGGGLAINYSFCSSPFGRVIVASTGKGVCYLGFEEDKDEALRALTERYPGALLNRRLDLFQQQALSNFDNISSPANPVKLHLYGTQFQLKVWRALLNIPFGQVESYGQLARRIHQPKATRAVATAIGRNPVAFFIPCHRVIRAGGQLGGYFWGAATKSAILGWEASAIESDNGFV